MRFATRALIAVIVFFATQIAGAATTYDLNDRSITVPDPPGLTTVPRLSSTISGTFSRFVPPENKMLRAYATPADREADAAGEAVDLGYYGMLQVNRRIGGRDISDTFFARLADEARNNWRKWMDRIDDDVKEQVRRQGKELGESWGKDLDLRTSSPVVLDLHIDRDDAVGFITVQNVQAQTQDADFTMTMVCAVTFIQTNQRIVFAYLYRSVADEAAIDRIKSESREWTREINKANR